MLWYANFRLFCFDFDLMLLPGQVYYTLLQEREEKGLKDVAISRLEQVSPFPYDQVCDV